MVRYSTAFARISAPPVKALNRHRKRESLTHNCTREGRPRSAGELDYRVTADQCRIARNDHSLEIARPCLKKPSAPCLFFDQHFTPLAKLSEVTVANSRANSLDEAAEPVTGNIICYSFACRESRRRSSIT